MLGDSEDTANDVRDSMFTTKKDWVTLAGGFCFSTPLIWPFMIVPVWLPLLYVIIEPYELDRLMLLDLEHFSNVARCDSPCMKLRRLKLS